MATVLFPPVTGPFTIRRNTPASYVVWFDGTNYRADSMTGLADGTPGTNANTVVQAASTALSAGLVWVKDISPATVGALTPKANVMFVYENNGLLTFTDGAQVFTTSAWNPATTVAKQNIIFGPTNVADILQSDLSLGNVDDTMLIVADVTTETGHQYNALDIEVTAEAGTSTSNIVGTYTAIRGKSGAGAVYAINPVLVLDAGYGSGAHNALGIEVDIANNDTVNHNEIIYGILVASYSAANTTLDYGVNVSTPLGFPAHGTWNVAFFAQSCNTGYLCSTTPAGATAFKALDSTGAFAFAVKERGTISTRQSATAVAVTQTNTTIAISLPKSEPNTSYQVYAVPNWGTTVFVTGKSTTGFTINFGTAAPVSATVDWTILRADGS